MKPLSPWLGVALIALGIVAVGVCAYAKVSAGAVVFALISLGISIVQTNMHLATRRELVELRASMRPMSSPSLPPLPTIPPLNNHKPSKE